MISGSSLPAARSRRNVAIVLLAAVSQLVSPVPASAQAESNDWPHLRGPGLDSKASAPDLESAVSLDFEEVWRRPLGSGYSAVVATGQTAVSAAAIDGFDFLKAWDALSGVELWSYRLAPSFLGNNGSDDGPSSSPTIGHGAMFSLHPSGRLVALDLESGQLRWQRHLVEDFGGTQPLYGFSSAPLLAGEKLIVQVGGSEGRLIVALSAETGDLLWSAGEDPLPIEHQNPMLWKGPGGEQVVVVSPSALSGFRLEDGRPLWKLDLEGRGHAGDVTVVDDRRLLLHRFNESSRLVSIDRAEDGIAASVIWESRSLDASYAIPIVHRQHVYGFDRRFLVCLELETGTLMWKSRPPSGQVLSLIGDHLAVVNGLGELVTVEAVPDGYRESGRHKLFRRRLVMTPVTYARGLLFARDLEEIVALRPVARREGARGVDATRITTLRQPSVAAPRFLRRLLREVGAGAIESALLDRHPSFPVIAGGKAHFLWLGDEPDVAILGDMTHFYEEVPLQRLTGTRVRWASFDATLGERWEYVFKLYEEERLDPRNRSSVESLEGERSVALMPRFEPWRLPSCEACEPGQVHAVRVESRSPGRSYEMTVYMPDGLPEPGERPLVMVADGAGARRLGDVVSMLDAMIGSRQVEPVVVALLQLPEAAWYPASRQRLAEILDQDLLPHLVERFGVTDEPARRALVSQRWAVDNTLLWALESGAVGRYAVQSPAMGEYTLEREIEPLLREARRLEVLIGYGRYDQKNPDYGLDVERQSRQLATLLRRHGHVARVVESRGGANWTRWREELARVLQEFFPLAGSI